jgi:hypothetical protein
VREPKESRGSSSGDYDLLFRYSCEEPRRAVSFAPAIVSFIKCECFRAREANGFDHVTLTRVAAALAVATNALAVNRQSQRHRSAGLARGCPRALAGPSSQSDRPAPAIMGWHHKRRRLTRVRARA